MSHMKSNLGPLLWKCLQLKLAILKHLVDVIDLTAMINSWFCYNDMMYIYTLCVKPRRWPIASAVVILSSTITEFVGGAISLSTSCLTPLTNINATWQEVSRHYLISIMNGHWYLKWAKFWIIMIFLYNITVRYPLFRGKSPNMLQSYYWITSKSLRTIWESTTMAYCSQKLLKISILSARREDKACHVSHAKSEYSCEVWSRSECSGANHGLDAMSCQIIAYTQYQHPCIFNSHINQSYSSHKLFLFQFSIN